MPVNLIIDGQAAANPKVFKSIAFNISGRARTVAEVAWSPDPWTLAGQRGPAQQTPDLSSVIQEIVDLPGWSGVAPLVLIVTGDGSGQRSAWSYNGTGPEPVLSIEYSPPA